ncbi:hypothetical protein DEO72_LG8g2377 [Vigna unguiculata]|uniref:Uncharacterized protein n=1 Tax=Vigna unguiculata TaxID=3917 RepID=A0A4D6MUP3_VIGUN|nr:hypothetical protein DEO72_LG8g2377 [Vigna unguiculata]
MHCLAALASPPSANVVDSGTRRMELAKVVFLRGHKDAWCLAVCVPCQAVWKRVSPGGSRAVPCDIVEAEGVKHVTFLELWLEMTSLELWMGMAEEHEELLRCGSGWRVLSVDADNDTDHHRRFHRRQHLYSFLLPQCTSHHCSLQVMTSPASRSVKAASDDANRYQKRHRPSRCFKLLEPLLTRATLDSEATPPSLTVVPPTMIEVDIT